MENRFHFGHSIRIAGPSQCGKTMTLCKLLMNPKHFYPNPPKRIMWVSGSGTRDLKVEKMISEKYPDSKFLYEVPPSEDLPDMVHEHDFWVFDDMALELKNHKGFSNMFTKTVHHKNCMLAYLTQNAYERGPDSTTRTRNCAYQIYFKNNTDVRWIRVLGDQLLGHSAQFKNIFEKATKEPYSCLLVDNRVNRPPEEQFICSPFSNETPYFLVPQQCKSSL